MLKQKFKKLTKQFQKQRKKTFNELTINFKNIKKISKTLFRLIKIKTIDAIKRIFNNNVFIKQIVILTLKYKNAIIK